MFVSGFQGPTIEKDLERRAAPPMADGSLCFDIFLWVKWWMACNRNQEDQGFQHSRSILARVLHSRSELAGDEILGRVIHCHVNHLALLEENCILEFTFLMLDFLNCSMFVNM